MELTERQDPPSDKLSARQRKILNSLIKEYIDIAEPISSSLLKQKCDLDVSGATIRNELQELTEQGYITQPHTSAGRVPTNKGYKYFVEIIFQEHTETPDFIAREIEQAQQKIEKELSLVRELVKSLTQVSSTLRYTRLQDKDTIFEMLTLLGPSRNTYDKNIDMMKELLKEFENRST